MRKIKAISKGIILISFYIVLGFLSVPLPHLIPAPQEAVRLEKPLQHEVSVTLKLIQVYVTDLNGKPVMHLSKSDFLLFDNAKPQTITDFEKHMAPISGPEPAPLEKPASEKKPENVASVPTVAPPSRLNRKFFFLIDLDKNDLAGIAKSRNAALHFLEKQVLPGDEIGVLSYSPYYGGLKVYEYLTSDYQKIREALDRATKDVPGRHFGEGPGNASQGIEGGIWIFGDSGHVVPRIKFTDVIRNFARILRYIPGYKNIIFFSQGIPRSVLAKDMFMRQDMEDMGRELASANAPVYAINTETPNPYSSKGSMGEDSLKFIAERSGGKALENIGAASRYEKFFQEIQDLTRNYYVLGYPVRETWDGKFHKIKVELRQGNYRIQTQAGYFNPKLFSDYSDVEKEMHLLDLAFSEKPLSQTPVRFPMIALACSFDPENDLFLAARIPGGTIREKAGKKTEVFSLVFDARGEIVSEQRSEEDFSRLPQEDLYFLTRASAPSGLYRCRIIIRNLETGAAAVASATATVPPKLEKGVLLFAPILLKPERGAFYLKGHLPKATVDRTRGAAFADLFLFDPAQYVPCMEKTFKKGTEAWTSFRCAFAGEPGTAIKISAFLFDKTTREEIPIFLTIINKKEESGMKTFFVRFQIPDVEPDEYTFCLVAEDPESGEQSMIANDFIIE